jgi:pimeloyl-ACP methyl ester carboxylesterase
VAETSYASCGDLSLAYQVFGDGPVELVYVPATIGSHVELCWTLPEFKAFFERLATFCRVLLFDPGGFGLNSRRRNARRPRLDPARIRCLALGGITLARGSPQPGRVLCLPRPLCDAHDPCAAARAEI